MSSDIEKAHRYLPPDDELLALPLLRLSHQVYQPKCHRSEYQSLHMPAITKSFKPLRLKEPKLIKEDKVIASETYRIIASKTRTNLSRSKEITYNHRCKNSIPLLKRRRNRRLGFQIKFRKMEGINILREIGRGSYGCVWLARRQNDEKILVLKSVDLSHLTTEQEESARQEVHILSGLKHPNIVSYKGSFELDHHLHLLMTYCEGGDLFTRIRQQHGTLFPEQQIVRWLIQLTMALQYLHSHNILHRDLKTQNIFLTRSGLIKLGDFGIAKILNSSVEMATTMIGTPYYMSPELFAGIPYSYKSDIWSLGCCVYELTTLKHAFHARDMSALICRISRGKINGIPSGYTSDLKNLTYSLMSRTPALRPSTAQILQRSFIREHITAFLKDTTNPSCASTRKDIDVHEHDCKSVPRDHIKDCKYDEEKYLELKPHLYARRHCEVLPIEFESLQISGDKIKLEDRSKIEQKPNGVKECHCERRDRKNDQPVSCIGSESRRRRRIGRKLKDLVENNHDSDVNTKPLNKIEESELHRCSGVESDITRPTSARERRRRQRLHDIETESLQESAKQRNSIGYNNTAALNDDDEIYTNEELDSSEIDSPRLSEKSCQEECTAKWQEVDDFTSMLDTTLNESSSVISDEIDISNIMAVDDSMDLHTRVLMLEETLLKAVGEVPCAEMMSLLKSGSWEDWEEQREQLCSMLSDQNYAAVATTLCHLKLCYCFLQD